MPVSTAQVPDLSIVIPAYNEATRLPITLQRIQQYIEHRQLCAEIIIADDGSDDDTTARVESSGVDGLRLLRLPHRGKAHAVRSGVLNSQGRLILFTDADLSTPIEHVERLSQAICDGADVAIGSREVAFANRMGEPSYRHLMGRAFNRLVQAVAVPGILDTQCGFKLFRREVAFDVFSRTLLHQSSRAIKGPRVTAFDVEILFIARWLGYEIAEVPVRWIHVPGSKVHPVFDSARMFADVIQVRINAARGRYAEPPDSG